MISEIDHVSMSVTDLIVAERFYVEILGEILGAELEDRKYLSTNDIVASRSANRFDPPQSRLRLGDMTLALFLYEEHVQEPPPEQLRGAPRLAISVEAADIDRAVPVLVRHGVPFEGPVSHPDDAPISRSLYFKDPSSNFIELCCPRAS